MSAPAVKSNLIKKSPEVKHKNPGVVLVARYLIYKLRDHYLTFIGDDGEFLRFLAPKRGNQVYEEWKLKPKVREIHGFLKKLVRVKRGQNGCGLTNALFITLTVDSKFDMEKAWDKVKGTSQFIDKLKKALEKEFGKLAYVRVLEAHSSGRPHVHLIIVLEKPIEFRIDAKGRGYILKPEVYNYLKNTIDRCWGEGFSDLRAVTGLGNALSYISKYAFKASEIESVLNKIRDLVEKLDGVELEKVLGEVLSETDIKKLYLHFYARQKHLRIFSTSRLKRLDWGYNNNSEKVGGWTKSWGIDLSPELQAIADKFTRVWLIRAGPGRVKVLGLVRQHKFLKWRDLEEGLRLKIMLDQMSELWLGKLARDIPFKFRFISSSLSVVFHRFALN